LCGRFTFEAASSISLASSSLLPASSAFTLVSLDLDTRRWFFAAAAALAAAAMLLLGGVESTGVPRLLDHQ
jgi:hypothetical protein